MTNQPYDFHATIKRMAQIQSLLQQVEDTVRKKRLDFEMSIADEKADIAKLTNEWDVLEAEIRAAALTNFEATGDLEPHNAISVYRQTIKGYDVDLAVEVAAKLGRVDLLKPAKADLNKAVNKGELPGVEVKKEKLWATRLSSKLGEYLIEGYKED